VSDLEKFTKIRNEMSVQLESLMRQLDSNLDPDGVLELRRMAKSLMTAIRGIDETLEKIRRSMN
jgi:hypothetical protein